MSNPGPSDQDLLILLSGTLCPPPEAPSAADREALRTRVIAARTARRALPVITWWRNHPTVLRFAAATAAVTAAVGAYLATNPLPQPVRSAAYSMGLPVDSPALVSARHSVTNLERAVATRDPQKIITAQHDLEHHLSELNHHDLAAVSPHADHAISEAQQCLDEEHGGQTGTGTEHSGTEHSGTGSEEHSQPAGSTPGTAAAPTTPGTATSTVPSSPTTHDSEGSAESSTHE